MRRRAESQSGSAQMRGTQPHRKGCRSNQQASWLSVADRSMTVVGGLIIIAPSALVKRRGSRPRSAPPFRSDSISFRFSLRLVFAVRLARAVVVWFSLAFLVFFFGCPRSSRSFFSSLYGLSILGYVLVRLVRLVLRFSSFEEEQVGWGADGRGPSSQLRGAVPCNCSTESSHQHE